MQLIVLRSSLMRSKQTNKLTSKRVSEPEKKAKRHWANKQGSEQMYALTRFKSMKEGEREKRKKRSSQKFDRPKAF